jgi:membrane protein YdbS with pleckstrin-like domain
LKIDIGNETHERRRKHYITPILYMLSEISLAWLILSIIMVNFNIAQWSIWTQGSLVMVILYSGFKTIKIYERQKNYKRG